MKIFISLVFIIGHLCVFAQTALVGGNVHVGDGETYLENGVLVFDKDRIVFVGTKEVYESVYTNANHTQIDVKGKEIYPALIAPNTTLGLVEVESVRASRDYQEVGAVNPNAEAITAYNVDSKIIPTTYANGILYAQITPQGYLLSGMSSVVRLYAATKREAVLQKSDGLHLFWPQRYWQYNWFSRTGTIAPNKSRSTHLELLKSLFEKASTNADSQDHLDLQIKAIREVVASNKRLYVHVDDAKEIMEAVLFFEKYQINNIVIVGGRDAWKLTDFLKERKISVILSRVHDLPTRVDESASLLYKQPYFLEKDSILFGLNYMGEMEAMGQRNLAFTAGTAAAYGLTKEQALKSISLSTAQILGVDKEIGSLEVGKLASVLVVEGDLLDMRTSIVIKAFLEGKEISLETHHTQLYNKHKKKGD
ncbi:MAG: amidohydrolase family protein [Cytophagales bacterium]|nr:amidohydrolase family protein [Cytophagales bacterium]